MIHRDIIDFTIEVASRGGQLCFRLVEILPRTGKNSPLERFPTGWKIRRRSVAYTIARISLQMSFPSFCFVPGRTARCKCAWKRVEIYDHPERSQLCADKI